MTRVLVTLGVILVVAGLAWPWLTKLGLSGNCSRRCSTSCIHAVVHLPGDIVIEREKFRFYFPITSMILISLVISLVLWLLRK
jgi:hypothetical protein